MACISTSLTINLYQYFYSIRCKNGYKIFAHNIDMAKTDAQAYTALTKLQYQYFSTRPKIKFANNINRSELSISGQILKLKQLCYDGLQAEKHKFGYATIASSIVLSKMKYIENISKNTIFSSNLTTIIQ